MAPAQAERSNVREWRYLLFRHSHGGTGCGSADNPFRPLALLFLALPSAYSQAHMFDTISTSPD